MITVEMRKERDRFRLYQKLRASFAVQRGRGTLSVATDQLFQLSQTFAAYVIETEEERRILKILRERFFFTDPEEQAQILTLVRSFLDGEKEEIPALCKLPSRTNVLIGAFYDFLRPNIRFCFESFLTFRLKKYNELLERYVEAAIDEYKLEQEYQTFVECLRNQIKNRLTQIKVVYVVCDDETNLYDDTLSPIKMDTNHFRIAVRRETGLECAPSALTTLIELAPERVIVFSDRSDRGIVLTLQNVFQERLTMKGLKDFYQLRKRDDPPQE